MAWTQFPLGKASGEQDPAHRTHTHGQVLLWGIRPALYLGAMRLAFAKTPSDWIEAANVYCISLFLFFIFIFFIQLQLSAFSPHPSTPPQPVPLPSPTSTLPLDFVLVSFIVAPIDPSPHYPQPIPLWLLLH